MKKIVLLLLSALAISVAGPYPYTHDGFFFNLALGMGYQNLESDRHEESFDLNETARGSAFEFDMKIGGRILPFTILHYTSVGLSNFADFEVDDYHRRSRYDNYYGYYDYDDVMYKDDESSTICIMTLQGLGVTRYFRPYNIFASVSVGASLFYVNSNNGIGSKKGVLGYGFQVAGGKGWWISENLGIGAQMSLTYGSADYPKKANASISAFAINFMATVTFN